ncbi:cyclodeaminase/cyclohydrolase family protein [Microbacterium sp. EST19A]|uniref:cyclodeaminase/cyclohydrolase family protein n=1 Tax=Microbacterium sp. EST19A TaxID=2862681 RepID=UPI001CC116F7|nr:cyclodeaminase/cyclohydrolase family protein [Microbacterium sp. EST19A]
MEDSVPVPTSVPLSDWLTELAQPTGAPGGGAACGVMLGISAALLRMVAEYTDDERATASAARLAQLRSDVLSAAEADEVSSAAFGAALALDSEDPEREVQVREAALSAAASSAALGEAGAGLLPELRLLVDIGNPHLAADLSIAADALATGIRGASTNLRANLQTASRHGARRQDHPMLVAAVKRFAEVQEEAGEVVAKVSAGFDA